MKKVAIIGHGFVGKGMSKIFPDAYVYDPSYPVKVGIIGEQNQDPDKPYWIANKESINKDCGLAIICVPTPPLGMGEQKVNEDEDKFLGVDLSYIEDVLSWLKVDLVLIKSTVPPGTTDMLQVKFGDHDARLFRKICFSPEYMGEGNYYTPPKYPDPLDPRKHDFMIIGGDKKDCQDVLAYFIPKLGPAKTYYIVDAVEAEAVKYMENTWGAMKVSFCQEWFEMCEKFGASYERVREGLLLDSRVEPMHTAVFRNKRGFGGKCYPKDLLGIISASEKAGYEPKFLKEVWETNKRMIKKND